MATRKIGDNWFFDISDTCYGVGVEIEEILYEGKSDLQDILIFQSKVFGKILVLDGAINYVERDEFCYNEMIANLPLNCHPQPKKVLIIGGCSGGTTAEVLKSPDVEQVVACEVDKVVADLLRKYFPDETRVFDDPRVHLIIEDGANYLNGRQDEFDIIISDNPDPQGPGESLFTDEYYRNIRKSLKADGIACFQGPDMFVSGPQLRRKMSTLKKMFGCVDYCYTLQPCSDNYGYTLCGVNSKTNFREPLKKCENDQTGLKYKYYNTDFHRACFSLPSFVKQELYGENFNS